MNHYEFSQKGGRSKSLKKQEAGRKNAEKARLAKLQKLKAVSVSAKVAESNFEPSNP
jgi:hypothetical protein